MMNKIFILVNSYWDSYSPIYFLGPDNIDQEKFISICNCLLNKACQQAYFYKDGLNYIGNTEITEQLVELLQEQGFILFQPKIYDIFGPSIYSRDTDFIKIEEFLDKKTIDDIIDYNKILNK